MHFVGIFFPQLKQLKLFLARLRFKDHPTAPFNPDLTCRKQVVSPL